MPENNKLFTWIPFYMELADKLLAYKDDRKPLVDIVYQLGEHVNFIHGPNNGRITDIDPFTVFAVINRHVVWDKKKAICQYFKDKFHISAEVPQDFYGLPEQNNMNSTFVDFVNDSSGIQPFWDLFVCVISDNKSEFESLFNIVRNRKGVRWKITMALFWIRPYDFINLDSTNRDYFPKIGIQPLKEDDYSAKTYLNLVDNLRAKVDRPFPQISYDAYFSTVQYWLVGYTFNKNESQIDSFINGSKWEAYFDLDKDKKQIDCCRQIKVGDYLILKSTFTKGSGHDISTLRFKQVGVVTELPSEKIEGNSISFKVSVDYYVTSSKDFTIGGNRSTIQQCKNATIIDYANYIITNNKTMSSLKLQKYVDFLKENKNVIFNGAPGTGKTYLAQEIAKAMNAESYKVQFHPSYDYTDFVEGLRPISQNGQIVFERTDGVFKAFCEKAKINFDESLKSKQQIYKDVNLDNKIRAFLDAAIEEGKCFHTKNNSEFVIEDVDEKYIYISIPENPKISKLKCYYKELFSVLDSNIKLNNIKDIREFFGRPHGTQQDSYTFVLANKIRDYKVVDTAKVAQIVPRKDFVFIIDEINRGEISKIFGELFGAIDPGYRGTQGIVKTQYQNLVDDGDTFKDGFYVPENVYIIGTMNDIDRSVESMDFAMRRRFAFYEVSADESADNMNLNDEQRQRMKALNDAIGKIEGLGPSYFIGGSYFLNVTDFQKLWDYKLKGLLKEYLRGMPDEAALLKDLEKAYFNLLLV